MGNSIITYLSFSGECEEAVKAYIDAFGGEIYYLSRWDENNCECKEQIGKVMHVEFRVGDTHMSGGDAFDDASKYKSTKLMVHMETKEQALKCINILEKDGTILASLQPHPAPDDGGMGALVKDKFGYVWIITCPNPDKFC